MHSHSHSHFWMHRALELAAKALYISSPNPRVGCVLADEQGVIGEGFTQSAGSHHAEVMALRDAQARGNQSRLRGASAYVTLEPCSHYGRTPPCTKALIEAEVGRVVVACVDPNPQVAGTGLEHLHSAGIEVELLDVDVDNHCAKESKELNIGFFKRMQTGLPWVRMKMAASLDGGTALQNGKSQWITGHEARRDGHIWRARSCMVLTGIGTVLADDPRMNVRHIPSEAVTIRQPLTAVVDTHLRTPPSAAILQSERGCVVYTGSPATNRLNAQIVQIPKTENAANTRLDLKEILRHAAHEHSVNELHLEAGAGLSGSFLQAGLVDELLIYLAPKMLGIGARGMAQWSAPLENLEDAPCFRLHSTAQVGEDLRLLLRVFM